uniref:Uncharacterized protein n=1 Tax=Cucumis melo TaxID=3656 RepID=A0A9I9CI39_CUCME
MDDHQKSLESSPASAIPTDSRSSVLSPIANWKISSFADDHREDVKARFKFWAKAVACTLLDYATKKTMEWKKI